MIIIVAVVTLALVHPDTCYAGKEDDSLPATLAEYDSLPRDKQGDVFRRLRKDLQDNIIARDRKRIRDRQQKQAEQDQVELRSLMAGRWQIREILRHAWKLENAEISSTYPQPTDPDRLRLLRASDASWSERITFLNQVPLEANVAIWKDHAQALDDVDSKFPLTRPSEKAVRELKRLIQPMLDDLKNAAKVKEEQLKAPEHLSPHLKGPSRLEESSR